MQTFMMADRDGSGRLAPNEFVKAFAGKRNITHLCVITRLFLVGRACAGCPNGFVGASVGGWRRHVCVCVCMCVRACLHVCLLMLVSRGGVCVRGGGEVSHPRLSRSFSVCCMAHSRKINAVPIALTGCSC